MRTCSRNSLNLIGVRPRWPLVKKAVAGIDLGQPRPVGSAAMRIPAHSGAVALLAPCEQAVVPKRSKTDARHRGAAPQLTKGQIAGGSRTDARTARTYASWQETLLLQSRLDLG